MRSVPPMDYMFADVAWFLSMYVVIIRTIWVAHIIYVTYVITVWRSFFIRWSGANGKDEKEKNKQLIYASMPLAKKSPHMMISLVNITQNSPTFTYELQVWHIGFLASQEQTDQTTHFATMIFLAFQRFPHNCIIPIIDIHLPLGI
jgi:hypothetical protein